MNVRHAMTTSPCTIGVQALVKDAIVAAENAGATYLVVEDQGRALGIVCRYCDLDGSSPDRAVIEVMSAPIVDIEADAVLDVAAKSMRGNGIGCLLVTDDGQVAGIVTRGDLLRAGFEVSPEVDDFYCASCGSHKHVHGEDSSRVVFCAVCLERARPPFEEEDLGRGD